ncbi:MAG: MarR family transcriptional regulator, partial [Gammaproteobacteria bacterium]|nr:MarR family transcriptional regulator [Gammaproteobacteria bacterium]
TVTTIIDRLELRGLIVRERSQADKRKVHALLTEAGNELLDRAPRPLQDAFIQRFQALEDWEQNMIIASLQRVAQMMDAGQVDAAPLLDVGAPTRQEGEADS